MRLSRDNVEAIHHFLTARPDRALAEAGTLHGSPFDRAGWGAMADALDEADRPHTAALVRRLCFGTHPEVTAIYANHRSNAPHGGVFRHNADHEALGLADPDHPWMDLSVAGLPVRVHHRVRIVGPGRLDPSQQFYHLHVLSHPAAAHPRMYPREATTSGRRTPAERPIAEFDNLTGEQVARLTGEADGGPLRTPWADVERHRPAPEAPARLSRPVRLGRSDVAPLWEAVKANPHDDAPWLVLADALDEAGKPATAAHMRDMGSRADRGLTHGHHGAPYRYLKDDAGRDRNAYRHDGPRLGTVAGVPFHIRHYDSQLASLVGHGDGSYILAGAHWMPQDRAEAIAAEFDRPGGDDPERFAARAPKGGLVVRGIQAGGGEFLPREATEAQPAPAAPVAVAKGKSRRERLMDVVRRRKG